MDFKDIVAINGRPGLYEMKAQSKGGFIVASLDEGKKIPIAATSNISALNEIAIYTYGEDVPLRVIFRSIAEKEDGKASLSHKESARLLTDYFREILPSYDEDRVYVSNIKKVLQWYNILASNDFDFSSIEEEEAVTETDTDE